MFVYESARSAAEASATPLSDYVLQRRLQTHLRPQCTHQCFPLPFSPALLDYIRQAASTPGSLYAVRICHAK